MCCEGSFFLDLDQDGYGNSSVTACTIGGITQGNAVEQGGDCNDFNGNANPGLIEQNELCIDDIDNDCDGQIDGADAGCTEVTCGGIVCSGTSATTYSWERNGTTCKDEEFKTITRQSNPYCDDDQCAYAQIVPTVTKTGNTRNHVDGAVCTNGGLCRQGICADVCEQHDQTPGCRETKPEGAQSNVNGCPLSAAGNSQTCYFCPEGYYWDHTKCVKETHRVTNVNDMQVVSNTAFILNPITMDFNGNIINDVKYAYNSRIVTKESAEAITVKSDKIGTYPVTITAYKTAINAKNVLATKIIEVSLTCPANTACCPVGTTSYARPGTSCSLNNNAGVCDQYGACKLACTNPEFENNAQTCSDGRDNDCDGAYDCVINNEGNKEQGCHAYCQIYCDEGEAACGEECLDLEKDHDNCGACNNPCDNDQVCEEGVCIRYLNCYVACDEDDDCGAGICIRPGKCDAYCENVPTIELTEEQQQTLLTEVARQKTYELRKTIIDDQLILEITNILGVPLNNVTITITVPKQAAERASEIGSDYPFDIVHDDPVIRTQVATIKGTKIITYYFPKNIDKELEEYFIIDVKHGLVTLSAENTLTNDELSITRAFREDADGTTVTLKLTPGKNLDGVRIPLEIPKCLAGSISEMDIKQDNYIIVNDDPLMVWTFDTLTSEQEIEFRVPRIVDDECKKLLKAFGLAEGKRTPISPWLPLAIIPIIGVILIFFQRFHEGGPEQHLSKQEFYRIARENGEEEHEIERAWYEYKRRF